MCEVTEVIGLTAYNVLSERVGGTDFKVPRRNDQGYVKLVEWIGELAARRLAEWAGGTRVYIRRIGARNGAHHYEALAKLKEKGLSFDEIARAYVYQARLSTVRVRDILRNGED